MIEKLFEFADAMTMASGATYELDYVIDWTAAGNQYLDMMNSGVSLWVVVTVNTVPAGTSLVVMAYQHTSAAVDDGDLLDTGDVRVVADISANAGSIQHILYARELSGLMATAMALTAKRYFGLAITADGDCSGGKVDAWLQVGKPKMPTTMVTTSNI